MLLTSQEKNSTGSMIVVWGQSEESYDSAIISAVKYASETVRALTPSGTAEWFEVLEQRGAVKSAKDKDGKEVHGIAQFQVALRVGYWQAPSSN